MSRRRPSLSAYVRRRWRAIGAIVVLLLGALLVLAVTDRGHDPVWETGISELDHAVIAPDGSVVYAIVREAGNVSGLEARRGDTGELLWESDVRAPRALLAASESSVAVATDFPVAFLLVYHADGSPRWQVPLEGNPIAMEMERDHLALALNAPGNPTLFFEGDRLVRTYRLGEPLRALDVESGLVAMGGINGAIVVHAGAEEIVNVSLPMSVRSLRLSHDGTTVLAGGTGVSPSDPRGRVAFLDVGGEKPLRWMQETPVGVGLVDLDAAGLFAMAIEEEPPSATIHVYEGSTGATRWTRLLDGTVSRDDTGASGGAAMSPDGNAVAVATLRGDVTVLSNAGEPRWSYRAGGATVLAFADDEPHRLLAGARLLENRPVDTLLLFLLPDEPAALRAPLLAAAIVASAAVALGLVVGVGFWRARRSY